MEYRMRRRDDGSKSFNRAAQDVGNIVALEHVNVRIPDQRIATLFYIAGLGFTRDPYLMVDDANMWVNMGQEQFHMPTGDPDVLRGHCGLVVPDLDALVQRLLAVKLKLEGTQFTCSLEDKYVAATSPWGNTFRLYAPAPRFGNISLGMAYVEFTVRPGTADGIARFYREIMGAPACVAAEPEGKAARVRVGGRQELIFRETTAPIPAFDGHHIAIYVTDFSGPHKKLKERGLLSEESNEVQYRFEVIIDPDSGEQIFEIEHEVRSFTHPMYLRPMVNRNAAQRQATYQTGRDAFVPGMV
jgi:hypothetical protein